MNVLSLFDGMSCGQIALNKARIKYDNYFASEIKEHGIKVTQHNYPGTKQLGDVTKITGGGLPKIDLLIGGSPCQDFSRGNATRDGLQGVKSGLFFEYLRLLKEVKPKYFLLENVIMTDADYAIISEYMGTEPVRINSSRVSAQLRDRLYWTNIGPEYLDLFGGRKCVIPQPEDKKLLLQDILENGWTDRDKSRALLESDSRPLRTPLKMFHRYHSTGFTTLVFKDEAVYSEMAKQYERALIMPELKGNIQSLMFDDTEEMVCLNKQVSELPIFESRENIRYLTQTELERLQTVPNGYTALLKRDDAACLLGDGWTVDVIAHIFSFIK
jgi:DNA (cytosine-5)-methyltransferase 3A